MSEATQEPKPDRWGSSQRKTLAATAWLILRESGRAFGANKHTQTAATLAYYGFLALMPLFLLLIYFLGVFMKSSDSVFSGMHALTARLFPSFSDAMLNDLLNLAHKKTWGVVSIVVLIWSMTPFAAALRYAYVGIFKSARQLSYVRAKLLDAGAVVALLLCFVLLVAGNMLNAVKFGWLFPGWHWLLTAIQQVFVFLLTVLVLVGFEFVFAPVRLQKRILLQGALIGAIIFAGMRPLFDLMLHFNPNYGYAFGSLKALFILFVWVYYTFIVLLFCAEVMAATWRKDALLLRGLLVRNPPKSRTSSILLERFIRRCADGAVLFREGETGRDMFYVLSGSVRLTKGERELRVMGSGDYFGEMSMLIGSPRTATATCDGDTSLIAIGQNNFEVIVRENPAVVLDVLKEMAQRLKQTNERLQDANTPPPLQPAR